MTCDAVLCQQRYRQCHHADPLPCHLVKEKYLHLFGVLLKTFPQLVAPRAGPAWRMYSQNLKANVRHVGVGLWLAMMASPVGGESMRKASRGSLAGKQRGTCWQAERHLLASRGVGRCCGLGYHLKLAVT